MNYPKAKDLDFLENFIPLTERSRGFWLKINRSIMIL